MSAENYFRDTWRPSTKARFRELVELAANRLTLSARDCIAVHSLTEFLRASAWYARQRQLIGTLGLPVSTDALCGALAALSPSTSWDSILAALPRWIATGFTSPIPAYPSNREKARRILSGADPLDVLSGDKVRAFYFGLTRSGKTDLVCVDRHSAALCFGEPIGVERSKRLTKVEYAACAEAHRVACSAVSRTPLRGAAPLARSLYPAELQAALWTLALGGHDGGRVRSPKTPRWPTSAHALPGTHTHTNALGLQVYCAKGSACGA